MTLQLDARQRAMLEEIGIKLFWPEAPREAPAAVSEPVRVAAPAAVERAEAPRVAPPAVAREAAPSTARTVAGDVASLDWDALQSAVSDWAATGRRKPVFGTGDLRADWLCVGDPPVEEEERQGLPFVAETGKLLDNMLAAVGASRRQGAYLTNVLKCRLPEDRAQEADEVAQSLVFLTRQVDLLQPKVILAMGRFAVQVLLQTNEPIGKLRGQVHRYNGVPVIVTYHPTYLLRTPADKAKAWADLCLARTVVRGEA